jgi:flavin reductase (DIM6/NTAB) family NADH-FMN oxidoreductase RutF
MVIDPNELTSKQVYKLLIGSVVPRPIAWVSTVNGEGVFNLAPFSFFTVASRQPPMLCISIGPGVNKRKGTIKDTLVNIRGQRDFVINIVSLPLANAMHQTSDELRPGKDEFKEAGLTPADSVEVKAPRVREATIQMECKLEKVIPIGSDHLVIGKLVKYHVKDHLYKDGKIDLAVLRPVGRLAGNYTYVDHLFELPQKNLEIFAKKG